MGYGYQKRDYEYFDYKLWKFDGITQPLRGPKLKSLEKDKYFSCFGAAQMCHCFCQKPFNYISNN